MNDLISARKLPGINKIAVLRANAIGDFIVTLPALEALRAAYPEAEITLLGKGWHEKTLPNRPLPIDRVFAVPPSRGVNVNPGGGEDANEDLVQLEQFFKRMRREKFDLGIQLHGGGRYSNPFLLNLGPRITAGLKTPEAAPLDFWVPYIYWQSETLRFLEVVSLVGASPVTINPHFPVIQADLEEVDRLFPQFPPSLVLVHPGATDPRRRWSPNNFALVADTLVDDGHQVVVIGGPEEIPLTEKLVSAMRSPGINLAGKLSLGGLAGLLSRCSLLIANDSGPRHLGEAVGARTVGIYWCGNMINAGPMSRTRHRVALSWRLDCPDCGVNTLKASCLHRSSFVDDVTVDEVLGYARELLSSDETTYTNA